MGNRTDLHEILKDVLGSNNVYFQAPTNTSIKYPCIMYKRSDIKTKFTDNLPSRLLKRYSITVIDADPDSSIPDKIASLPTSIQERSPYVVNGLYHYVFNLYF